MKDYLEAGHASAVQRIQHRFAAWRDALDLREAELLADLEQMCARDRAKMESQVEEFQVCECERQRFGKIGVEAGRVRVGAGRVGAGNRDAMSQGWDGYWDDMGQWVVSVIGTTAECR
jgi:hypothetical protein